MMDMEVDLFDVNAQNCSPAARISVTKLIPRSNLPLSWLDCSTAVQGLPGSAQSFFSSTSPLLDKLIADSPLESVIIIAKDNISGRFCAVEKVRNGVFTLCWIGQWVGETVLGAASISIGASHIPTKRKAVQEDDKWWVRTVLPATTPQIQPEPPQSPTKRIKLDLSIPVLSDSVTRRSPETGGHAASFNDPRLNETPMSGTNDLQSLVQLDKDQLFENFACQYLETLYLNRTSLAFFAKGPLSRFRMAFSSPGNETLNILDLTIFIRNMVLTFSAMDKKYKEKLPELARTAALEQSDEEDNTPEKKRKRSRSKKKKLKLSREGVYPFESEYTQKWWKNDAQINNDETGDQRIKRRIGEIRIRETLMQIILVLEILALEGSGEWKTAHQAGADSAVVEEVTAEGGEKKQPKKRVKRIEDFNILLDLLTDKMAIWQSVENDLHFMGDSGKDNERSWNKDRLGSFCVEVIIPFYKSRVPKQAAQIVKSFGGPSQSPNKRRKLDSEQQKLSKSSSKATKDMHSREAESQAKKPSNKLAQRNTSASDPRPARPSLARSLTDSVTLAPGFKREGSERPSLFSIPLLQSQERKKRRDSQSSLKHLQARQVSLSTITASTSQDAKRKRKAAVDDEIRDAINSIKKPNRTGIGREVADERERRNGVGASKSKIQKSSLVPKPSVVDRKALRVVENVQVLATPHAGRKIHVESQPIAPPRLEPQQVENVPASLERWRVVTSVPSTAKKENTVPRAIQERPIVMETPTKAPLRQLMFASPDTLGDSAMKSQPSFLTLSSTPVINITPVRPRSQPTQISDGLVSSTPVPALKKTASHSIYDSLGWDKYDDLDD